MIQVGILKNNLPYSDFKNGIGSGIAFEIWNEFAKKYNIEYQLVEYASFNLLVEDVSKNKVQVGVGPISVTEKRIKMVDYSRAFTLSEIYLFTQKKPAPVSNLIKLIIPFLLFLILGILFAAKVDNDTIFHKFAKGILHFFQYSYIIENPKNNFHLLFNIVFTIIAFIFSVFIVGFILSYFSSHKIQIPINDFIGKKVGYEEGSYFNELLENYNIIPISYTDKKKALDDVKNGAIDAYLDDLHVLENVITDFTPFEKTELLRAEEYAFVINKNWNYKNDFDLFMIESRENGFQKKICQMYLEEQNIFCFL